MKKKETKAKAGILSHSPGKLPSVTLLFLTTAVQSVEREIEFWIIFSC